MGVTIHIHPVLPILHLILWLTKAAVPLMKPGASIINTTSVQAYDPSKGIVDYAMTKAAIANFTKGIGKQLWPRNPSQRHSPRTLLAPHPTTGQPPESVAKLGSSVTLGRPGQQVEIAPVYVLLSARKPSISQAKSTV